MKRREFMRLAPPFEALNQIPTDLTIASIRLEANTGFRRLFLSEHLDGSDQPRSHLLRANVRSACPRSRRRLSMQLRTFFDSSATVRTFSMASQAMRWQTGIRSAYS